MKKTKADLFVELFNDEELEPIYNIDQRDLRVEIIEDRTDIRVNNPPSHVPGTDYDIIYTFTDGSQAIVAAIEIDESDDGDEPETIFKAALYTETETVN
jgi:predicted alpha/beta superfamily hydrolase